MTWRKRLWGTSLLAGLVLLGIFRSHLGTRLDSFTVDEPWHVVAGASYVRTGDFRLNPEHPPLAKLWVGAAMPRDFRLRPTPVLKEKLQERDLVEETMFFDNDPARAQHRARIAMWSLHGVLLLVLGLLLWRAFGLAWTVGSLAFLAIEPTVAAHLPVVMTDLPLGLTLLVAAVCGGLLAADWRWRWVAGFGVAMGLALGAKHSALPGVAGIVAMLALAALWSWRRGGLPLAAARLGKLALAGMLAVAVLWAQYGFHFHAGAEGSDGFNRAMADKVADLNLGHWRQALALADRGHLLPRSYLWGLADTVRTGVEGRGISQHVVWGKVHEGQAPWFSWPLIIASKVPLALLLLALLGVCMLWRAKLSRDSKWVLAGVLAGSAAYLGALLGSEGIWGGIRHAMPLVVALSIAAGAALSQAWTLRARTLEAAARLSVVAVLLVGAAAMTLGEKRLWEYHNELVGGSDGAWEYFGNEGLDLGQRFGELRAFHDRVVRPSGQSLYSNYWVGEEQMRAARFNYRRRVESLDDSNVQGVFDGYFIYTRSDHRPWPSWDWDPALVFKDLRPVARFGFVEVWHGRQVLPRTRAASMGAKIFDYIYKDNGDDWQRVARRLEEVAALFPQSASTGIELANAYVRLGDGLAAVRALRRPLDQHKAPVDARIRDQIQARITLIEQGADLSTLKPLRNPEME
ncbi:MAG: hypothetical protein EOP92_34985 [Lysobacteraceae bacterium]|nr:MAG: hypothetical protein EOP92_34985 [Xanthomonadaceae bacterium]